MDLRILRRGVMMKTEGKHEVEVASPDKVVVKPDGTVEIYGDNCINITADKLVVTGGLIKADNLKIGNEPKTGAGNE